MLTISGSKKSLLEFAFHTVVLQNQVEPVLHNGEFLLYGFSTDYYLTAVKAVTV